MTRIWAQAAVLFAFSRLVATPLLAQEKTLTVTSDVASLDVGGRVQTQLNTTTVDSEPDAQLFLRRARIELDLEVSDLVSGRLQTDFAGERVSVKDAYLQLRLSPAFRVVAGKAYRPFGLLEQTSSIRILPIERGLSIRGVADVDEYRLINTLGYSDRDVGLQVAGAPSGAPLGLSYAAGVFAGPQLPGRPANTSPFQLAARGVLEPVEGLRLGAGWSARAFSPADTVEARRGDAFEVDLEIGGFDPGVHFLGEVTTGDMDPFSGGEFFGAQGWLGFRTQPVSTWISAVEPILRVSYGDFDDAGQDRSGGTLLTPGINVYFGGYNRVMFNYDVWSPQGGGQRAGSFKTQFQLVF